MWFFILFWSKKQFLLTVSQKWMQNGPGLDSGWVGLAGLGRAGWAGLAGWLGWLAGLPGLACWAGCAGPGWAGTLPGIGFVDFWNQGQNLIKSSFLGLVFSISGANARKCLNRASWDSFYRLLEPRPESHQIKLPGTGFLDFWSQRQKVFKSSFLGFVLSTSGAKARKSSNRVSWDWFCLINTSIHDTGTYYIRRTFYSRIIVHWVTCSWVLCLLTEPAGDPRKICVYAKVFPY